MKPKLTFDEIKAKIDEAVEKDRKSGKFDKTLSSTEKASFVTLARKRLCEKW